MNAPTLSADEDQQLDVPVTAESSSSTSEIATTSANNSTVPYADPDDDGILPFFADESMGYDSDESYVFMIQLQKDSQPVTFDKENLPTLVPSLSTILEQKDDPSGLKRGENPDSEAKTSDTGVDTGVGHCSQLLGQANKQPALLIKQPSVKDANPPATHANAKLAAVSKQANLSVKFTVCDQTLSGILDSGANVNLIALRNSKENCA
ncbi:hypothetical protein TYRP_001412 [Tyrophagus putrescentiae]|nr:hypothetical protein TYRP_001412 [Tyrophagus putrescentiae]